MKTKRAQGIMEYFVIMSAIIAAVIVASSVFKQKVNDGFENTIDAIHEIAEKSVD